MHLEALERVLASIPLPPGSVVTLTDENSVVVARSLDAAQYVGRSAAPGGQARNPFEVPASAVLTGVDGVERVFGNGVVERGPWLASVGIPTSVAMSRTWPIFQRNFGIAVAATVVIIALDDRCFGRRWLHAFDHLDETAKRVSRGDLSPLQMQPMPTAEMDRLQGTVSSMITNLQRARESIAAQVDDERRMREELQSLQQQVIRQERLAAIGVLVSGVAHELNNPLQAILGFAELLQMQKDMPEQARADLTLIQKESARASAIIRNLSRFGRQMSEPTPVRLRDVVASVMELRQRKLEELNITVEIDERSTALVMAIFTELQQVVLNFAINAEQAIVHAERSRAAGHRPHRRSRRLGVDRSRGLRPRRAGRARSQAVPAVLHDEAGRRGHRARTVGELRHHSLAQRPHRLPPRRDGRRRLLLRAADRAARSTSN